MPNCFSIAYRTALEVAGNQLHSSAFRRVRAAFPGRHLSSTKARPAYRIAAFISGAFVHRLSLQRLRSRRAA